MARSTRSRVAGATGKVAFITFETVLGETPARAATSLTVARPTAAPLSARAACLNALLFERCVCPVQDICPGPWNWLGPTSVCAHVVLHVMIGVRRTNSSDVRPTTRGTRGDRHRQLRLGGD